MIWRAQAGFGLAAAGICALLGWLPGEFRAGRVVEWKLRDAHVLLMPERTPAEVVLVTVDEAATEAFEEPLLFWHGYYAEAIERMAEAGARVVALDMVFGVPVERWAPGLDPRLAGAAMAAESRGTAVLVGTAALGRQKQEERAVGLNMLAASLDRLADVALVADEDDFVRRVQLVNDEGTRALSLAAAEAYLGRAARRPAGGVMEIRHAGPAGTVKRMSLKAALEAEAGVLKEWAGGRIVLIGADLPVDRHATPYYAFRAGLPANTAGVEIHASAIATLLGGRWREEAADGVKWAGQWLAALGGVLLGWRWRGWRLGAALGIWVAVVFGVAHGVALGGWWMSQTGLAVGVMAGAGAGVGLARGRLRAAVRVYGGGAVEQAVERTGRMAPEARRVRATVVFTDARGFSAWSEDRAPEEVAAGLNQYFDGLAAAARRHGGEVNKLVGDGMLVLFLEETGADHAARAVAAVREMLAVEGELRTSAGIHTGEVVMGVIGSGGKLEYTAMGDAVNVAARLEHLNREAGTRVLMSGAVVEEAGLTARAAGCFLVKGRRAAVEAYTLEEG
jgi:adenylate cyclase